MRKISDVRKKLEAREMQLSATLRNMGQDPTDPIRQLLVNYALSVNKQPQGSMLWANQLRENLKEVKLALKALAEMNDEGKACIAQTIDSFKKHCQSSSRIVMDGNWVKIAQKGDTLLLYMKTK